MPKQIKIAWREKYCNTTDRIPLEWFKTNEAQSGLVHDVFFNRKWYGEAMCDVKCIGNRADLDYTKHQKFNRKQEMLLGVMSIYFADEEREDPRRIEWSGELEIDDGRVPDEVTSATAKLSVVDDLIEDLNDIRGKVSSRKAIVEARLGQGKYRDNLMVVWKGSCAVSEVRVAEVLRASHIKPWSKCTAVEKTDRNNRLLLAANLDALFDRYLISFEDDGEMIISDLIPEEERAKIQLKSGCKLRLRLNGEQRAYMQEHRQRLRMTSAGK